jgi:uncharacterized NAD(P)/FAD-binding protein YdhS
MTEGSSVLIIGGGFSGTMLAVRLAELGASSSVIEKSGEFGTGLAYSTPFDGHLLNVRSNRMSAIESRPSDFVDWLRVHRPDIADPEDFAPRKVYGQYLRDRLASAQAARPGLIHLVTGTVTAIGTEGVILDDARTLAGRAVIIATGNPSPGTTGSSGMKGEGERDRGGIIHDPWQCGVLERIGPTDDVLIIGTGLTMVDVLLSLNAQKWRGHATALSRRGLLPREHGECPDTPVDLPDAALAGDISKRLMAVRRLLDHHNWREVMEAYRPITADLWARASMDQRARMVRHLRPWWDVHRHRLAPRLAKTLDGWLAEGRLTLCRGRLVKLCRQDEGVAAFWKPRGPDKSDTTLNSLSVPWVIDCSGPAHSAASDPLTGPLVACGQARLDPLGLGLDLEEDGRLLRVDGSSQPGVFVLGPPSRAAFWETIAVPDIRKRIEAVATALTS